MCGDISQDESSFSDDGSDEEMRELGEPLYGSSTEIMQWQSSLPVDETRPPETVEEQPDQTSIPPPDSIEEKLEQGHQNLRTSEAYSWLISIVRRKIHMSEIEPHVMESHRHRILETLRKNTPEAYQKISRKRKPNQFSVHFRLRWNMFNFLEEQQYCDGGIRGIIGRVITLTGDHQKAYASSLRDYMAAIWPSTGPDLVEFFEDLRENPQGLPISKKSHTFYEKLAKMLSHLRAVE